MTEPSGDRPVLIAYDGSPHSQAAAVEAGRLVSHRTAVVLTAWQSVGPAGGMALAGLPADVAEEAIAKLDAAAEEAARACADEGAQRAAQAGLAARPRAILSEGPLWRTILDVAEEEDARMVVMGSRGRSAIASALLGSVSHGVVQRSRRPVLLVTADVDVEDGADRA